MRAAGARTVLERGGRVCDRRLRVPLLQRQAREATDPSDDWVQQAVGDQLGRALAPFTTPRGPPGTESVSEYIDCSRSVRTATS